MRSRNTNFLQVTIILTGLIFIAVGIVFYISPVAFGWIFSIDVNEDWLKEIPKDSFLSSLYFLMRGFSALLFVMGVAMVMPLFDPVRYRGLIYYTGILFPALASFILVKNGIALGHSTLMLFGFIFAVLLVMTVIGLLITRKEAQSSAK